MNKDEQLAALMESAIEDFRKLKPFIGDAADAVANLYASQLEAIVQPDADDEPQGITGPYG